MRRQSAVLLVILAIAVSAWIWQAYRSPDPALESPESNGETALTTASSPESPKPESDESLASGAHQEPAASSPQPVKRVPLVDAAEVPEPPASEVLAAEPEELADLLTRFLDAALNGDLRSANEVARIRRRCFTTPRTRAELEAQLQVFDQRRQWFQNRSEAIPQPNIEGLRPGPRQMLSNAEENRANLERWFSSCEPIRNAFVGDFRSDLESLARRGDVVARFLYATWPPREEMEFVPYELQHHWENNAREFSNLNLEAGEPAGILAYSRSYYEGLFTTRNFDYGVAGAITALSCGYSDPWLEYWVERQLDGAGQMDMSPEAEQKFRERQLRILETAEDMSHYCR